MFVSMIQQKTSLFLLNVECFILAFRHDKIKVLSCFYTVISFRLLVHFTQYLYILDVTSLYHLQQIALFISSKSPKNIVCKNVIFCSSCLIFIILNIPRTWTAQSSKKKCKHAKWKAQGYKHAHKVLIFMFCAELVTYILLSLSKVPSLDLIVWFRLYLILLFYTWIKV